MMITLLQELLGIAKKLDERLCRMETRFTSWAHNAGVDIHRNIPADIDARVLYEDGALYITHPTVPVGELMMVARRRRLPDPVPVYLNGRLVLHLRIVQ